MKNLIINLIFIFLPFYVFAQQTGDAVIYKVNIHNTDEGGTDFQYILKLHPENRRAFTFELLHFRYTCQESFFDDRELERSTLSDRIIPIYASLIGKPLKVKLNASGLVSEISGWEPIEKRTLDIWGFPFDRKWLSDFTRYAGKTLIGELLMSQPDRTVAFRSEWTNANKVHYTVTAVKGALVDITAKSAEEYQGETVDGKYTYNTVRNLVESAESALKRKAFDINPPFEKTTKLHMISTSKAHPDTARLNMAMTTRLIGTAFRKGAGYDSVKMLRYFRENDAQFANDPIYRTAKLELLQRFDSPEMTALYDSALAKTPNHLIDRKEFSQAFNKLTTTQYISADTTYAISAYFAKERSFYEWFQQAYAQHFKLENRDWKTNLRNEGWTEKQLDSLVGMNDLHSKKDHELLALYHRSKDPVIKLRTEPLYLWVEAKKNAGSKKLLVKTAGAFMRMSDEQLQMGNGPRYALLVYKLMIAAGEKKQSAALLSKTISNLDRLSQPEAANRFANKNMLAYAYFLAWQSDAKRDSAKAITYLRKAAEFSPKNGDDKAHSSFYDRVMLDSKESYREDYLARLYSTQDKSAILHSFSELIMTEPDLLDSLKSGYLHHFPKDNFRQIFTDSLMRSWKTAPDFTLKKLDGADVKLADYRKKWLVLDFWGTWCGPCRAEMPQLNEFYARLSAGEHPGVDFLSIACHDMESNVKNYLAETKFNLPVLMSDNEVQRKYNVRGYPEKVLISPDGKMLTVAYGQDWLTILKQFQANYLAAE
ncbi:MAG: TlpA family protein disulfide reductase [Mucilaginibacter polytrichastri]|nr:TlpA family protein disulfide reductase [Mucilaginibacter polytrichastri]